ncbi:helix-turn-helix domain-containing protein [Lysobacter enzymogenes]|uniref:helix-turn-helix domain-containing protein n=1 Tax=Lysobacter enzymogenes TaxID=69 RepID=UPI00099C3AAD|nr:helix-turn-helix transcriptional regulator [Lysobacter enzymogenes]UZW60267.1 helix-turn-helix transcriptional regulator [Lysobacter enzymogenes]
MGEESLQLRLGAAIRQRRMALGLSQEGFADAIKMHRAYYSKIERGERNLTLMTLLKVASGLGTKPSQLLRDVGY